MYCISFEYKIKFMSNSHGLWNSHLVYLSHSIVYFKGIRQNSQAHFIITDNFQLHRWNSLYDDPFLW